MTEPLMTVGAVSKRTGMSARLIRHLTDLGLIYSPGRSAGNYRLYNESALWCVETITRMRALGLTISEIKELAEVYLSPSDADIGEQFIETLTGANRRLITRIDRLLKVKVRQDSLLASLRDGRPAVVLPPDPTRA